MLNNFIEIANCNKFITDIDIKILYKLRTSVGKDRQNIITKYH